MGYSQEIELMRRTANFWATNCVVYEGIHIFYFSFHSRRKKIWEVYWFLCVINRMLVECVSLSLKQVVCARLKADIFQVSKYTKGSYLTIWLLYYVCSSSCVRRVFVRRFFWIRAHVWFLGSYDQNLPLQVTKRSRRLYCNLRPFEVDKRDWTMSDSLQIRVSGEIKSI